MSVPMRSGFRSIRAGSWRSLIIAEPGSRAPERAERTRSARGALASLSLSMLLSSLGTSIANVGLPTLAQAFNASFQDVQWIVLAISSPSPP